MGCFYENNGQYSGITQEIINAIDAACEVVDSIKRLGAER